jgi:protein tyrosine phosphatase
MAIYPGCTQLQFFLQPKKMKVYSQLPIWKNQEEKINYILNTYKTIRQLQSFRLEQEPERFSYSVARLSANARLNRYIDILPFDYNRVKLNNSFINASFMESILGLKQYIVAQGPLPDTVEDFWNMIWEQKCGLIVMLTPLVEKGRVKCHQYWPDQTALCFGELKVSLIKEETLMGEKTIHRTFEVQVASQTLVVDMVHFNVWPDHKGSDPSDVLAIVDFANEIYTSRGLACPMVVHCSAGVGRTGTFCTIDSVLHFLSKNIPPITPEIVPTFLTCEWEQLPKDIIALTVNHFRHQRISAVQSEDQYILCYEAVLLKLNKVV